VQEANVHKAKTVQETTPSLQDVLLPMAVQRTRKKQFADAAQLEL
jgi:hypothetical protein